jgi:hypothetical protein
MFFLLSGKNAQSCPHCLGWANTTAWAAELPVVPLSTGKLLLRTVEKTTSRRLLFLC